jgi:hypothetical protein
MKERPQNPHEAMCLATATHFTACRGYGNNRVRYDCKTMDEAVAVGEGFGDGRTMIYAVNALGNSAHIRNA